jgi:hypothetical protein
MARKKGSDSFSFKDFKGNEPVKDFKRVIGADNKAELLRPLPFKRRFRPTTGTKNFSILSDYDYASLWCRWRRGYELAMYSQQAYDGLVYSFKYYLTGQPPFGVFLPGIAFMYPSTRADMRMWMVGIRPRDSFKFIDFGYSIQSVTDYDPDTYAVVLNGTFGAPISFFKGEVLSNRFNADGTQKDYGFNNYTVTAVGINGVPANPGYAPIFNTLFLSHTKENSWSVVDATKMAVPATGPPSVGEYLATEMRAQCTCPDFLGREGFNLYEASLRRRYPYTKVLNLDPGFYDAGPDSSQRVVPASDAPGFARSFGFIYLNEIYDTPRISEATYSDPNVYYYQPRWCKHIYAAMWDLQLRYQQTRTTSPWLPQPTDEPMNEYYREKFEIDLKKQTDFYRRERDLVWWQRYSPTKDDMPMHMMYPDMYNMMTKTLNAGGVDSFGTLVETSFEMFTISEFNPFQAIAPAQLQVYDGGRYRNGVLISQPTDTLVGGTYANGVLTTPDGFPVNGGTY